MSSRRRLGTALAAGLMVLAAACTDKGSDLSPEEALAAAKKQLDETSGVQFAMTTGALPDGVSGIRSATGVGTHAPAFEGEIEVVYSGLTASVPVVAVDGKTYAVIPLTQGYSVIDPADYGAPDPAGLMSPDTGLSSLLTALESPSEGEATRSGDQVLTEYSGTLPGQLMQSIIPAADAATDFDAAFTLDDDERLRRATLTGPFYGADADPVTYTLTFDQYDVKADIVAPRTS